MVRLSKALPLSLVVLLSACSSGKSTYQRTVFCFDTVTKITLKEDNKEVFDYLERILLRYDQIADNYQPRDICNVYSLNHIEGNAKVKVGNGEDEAPVELVDMIAGQLDLIGESAFHFSIMLGSLSKKWKDSLNEGKVLDQTIIDEELAKINDPNSGYGIRNDGEGAYLERNGDIELDLGAVAKGAALDSCKAYLITTEVKDYIIDAGSSSILLGEKSTEDGLYSVRIKDLPDATLKVKNCFVSTSGIREQGVTINGKTYSHIIDPFTGSAISLNDTVIVITDNGLMGDVLSTSFMNAEVEEIEEVEKKFPVKSLVIRNKKIIHQHQDIELY